MADELAEIMGTESDDLTVYFDDAMLKQAVKLGAGARAKREDGGLIYGQDVADQLASEWIVKTVADTRKELDELQNDAAGISTPDGTTEGGAIAAVDPTTAAEADKEQRSAERAATAPMACTSIHVAHRGD